MNKLVSDGGVKKINYPVLYESGITPPSCEVSAPEPDAGGGGNALWHMFINHHGIRFLKILTL
ncbi:protein TrbG [Escherichia coli M605]|uniref:Protein TrbG n=1 Tax=Escherichia coli M605 TaxID=656417 RepID=F4STW5_ECOLX|nr:protein TrbG [Escherichia coli M605]